MDGFALFPACHYIFARTHDSLLTSDGKLSHLSPRTSRVETRTLSERPVFAGYNLDGVSRNPTIPGHPKFVYAAESISKVHLLPLCSTIVALWSQSSGQIGYGPWRIDLHVLVV